MRTQYGKQQLRGGVLAYLVRQGGVEVKGKGRMETYIWDPEEEPTATIPPDVVNAVVRAKALFKATTFAVGTEQALAMYLKGNYLAVNRIRRPHLAQGGSASHAAPAHVPFLLPPGTQEAVYDEEDAMGHSSNRSLPIQGEFAERAQLHDMRSAFAEDWSDVRRQLSDARRIQQGCLCLLVLLSGGGLGASAASRQHRQHMLQHVKVGNSVRRGEA
eukprot:1148502-Pelagomonas_calceolata.AAC.8